MAKKVLIITYYWPPASGPGVQRVLKFSKYLPQFGWQPIILTTKDGSYPHRDESLLQDVPDSMEVHRTKTTEPFLIYNRLRGKKDKSVPVGLIGIKESRSVFQMTAQYIRANMFSPDARVGWNRHAYRKAKQLIGNNEISAIITSGPPHSTHLVGLRLKREFGLPWLADFRDPWTNAYFIKSLPRSGSTKRKEKRMEDKVISGADGVSTVSNGLRKEFLDRNANTQVVYNGYDAEDMPELKRKQADKFSLEYVGNFKPSQNAAALWQALGELVKEDEGFAKDFELAFTGKVDDKAIKDMEAEGLKENIKLNGFQDHKTATKIMGGASLLLFIIPKSEGNELILTGKIFEYLATNGGILSIGPVGGDADVLLRESGRDAMIDYADKEAIKQQLQDYYQRWKNDNGLNFKYADESFTQYSRQGMTEHLANLLNQISE